MILKFSNKINHVNNDKKQIIIAKITGNELH